jgi:SPP1 family predicted phage head-tail adaptor
MPLRRLSFLVPPQGAYTPVGAMDREVSILAPSGRNSDGSTPPLSPFVPKTWAAIRLLQGDELYKAQQIAQEVTHLVTIAWQPGITEQMQVSYQDEGNARLFQIKAVQDPDERKVELRILAMEIQNL